MKQQMILTLAGCLILGTACDQLKNGNSDEYDYERQEEYNENNFQENEILPSRDDRQINGDH